MKNVSQTDKQIEGWMDISVLRAAWSHPKKVGLMLIEDRWC